MSNWGTTQFNKGKITWVVGGALVAGFPVMLWAFSYGPNPGASGAPKDAYGAMACASSRVPVIGELSVTLPEIDQSIEVGSPVWSVLTRMPIPRHKASQLR